MKKVFTLTTCGVSLFLLSLAFGADSTTTQVVGTVGNPTIRKIEFSWAASDVTADVSQATTTERVRGWVYGIKTIPNPATRTPALDYDIEINREGGVDILGGIGYNRSNKLIQVVQPAAVFAGGVTDPVFVDSYLGVEVLNATPVTSASGTVTIYYTQFPF